jgi:glyoxylase-like metal-dependent hydrolase (beta-lactamase superfamily II)
MAGQLMQVIPGVHLVGSGWLGFSLTDSHDCNVFLVGDGDDAALVDAGCGLASRAIADNIAAARATCGIARPSRLLLSHAHPDHAAGAASLATLIGATVHASEGTAPIVGSGDDAASGLHAARRAGAYPPAVRMGAVPVQLLHPGQLLQIGSIQIEAVATPGHAAGHLCFLARIARRRVLFSGDLVFSRGRVAVLATPDTDLGKLAASIERAATLRPGLLLPGHGALVLDDAGSHLDVARRAFANHLLPPGLLT